MKLKLQPAVGSRGFSLVEVLVVVAVIGILVAIAIGVISGVTGRAKVRATASDFRTFQSAFVAYSILEGNFPPDAHNSVPAGVGMEVYLTKESFEREAPISGRYNWEGPDRYPYAGISLTTTNASVGELLDLDRILDDGDLSTGSFRQMANGRYTFVVAENP